MEEMIWRRRLAVAASVLALGGFGIAAAGCGDDNGDSEDIENAADDAVQEGEEAAGDVGDAADEAIDDGGAVIEDASEDAEDEAEDATDDSESDDGGGSGSGY